MLPTGWLPCSRCGAWGGGAICPGCGAGRGKLVPLDRGVGDPARLPRWDGPPGQVQEALLDRAADGAVDADARARLGLAARLIALLPPTPSVQVWLDLRPAAAGQGVGPPQRDGSRVMRLPWLVLLAGPHEARVVRVATVKPGLRFRAGQVGAPEGPALDELCLRGPEGVARRPLRAPATLEALPPVEPLAPWPGPLPATVPGLTGSEPGEALAQAAAAAVLMLVLALGMDRAVAGPSGGAPVAAMVHRALGDPDPRVRRGALPGSDALGPLDQGRLLREVAAQDPDDHVRGLALELLARRGELGATCLALTHRSTIPPFETRLQALRLLRDQADPRALALARAELASGRGTARLRRAWAEVVGEQGDLTAVQALLEDPEPGVRAVAGRALLARGGPASAPSVTRVLSRGGLPRADSEAEAAQVALARALRRLLPAEERARLRADPALCARARTALE